MPTKSKKGVVGAREARRYSLRRRAPARHNNRQFEGIEVIGRLGGRKQQEVLVASSAAQELEDGLEDAP